MNLPDKIESAPSRTKWPWIMLALWAAWLAILIIMSWTEWGRERQSHDEVPAPQQAKKELFNHS